MSEIEKMARYVERTGMDEEMAARYDIYCNEIKALMEMGQESFGAMCDALGQAFLYGRAKGYRAGRKAARA